MLSKYITLLVCHPLVCHLTVVYDYPSILPLPQNVTINVLSKNSNGRMTVLCYIVSTKIKVYLNFTVLKRSTATIRAKLYTVFQEVLRLLYNVSLRLPW